MFKRIILPVLLCMVVFVVVLNMPFRLNHDGFVTAADMISSSAMQVSNDISSFEIITTALRLYQPDSHQEVVREDGDESVTGYFAGEFYFVLITGYLFEEDTDEFSTDYLGSIRKYDLHGGNNDHVDDITNMLSLLNHNEATGVLSGITYIANWFKIIPLLFSWISMIAVDILGVVISLVRAGLFLLGF